MNGCKSIRANCVKLHALVARKIWHALREADMAEAATLKLRRQLTSVRQARRTLATLELHHSSKRGR